MTENKRHFEGFSENDAKHWAEAAADRILAEKPDEELYTFSSGISPSGTVHFGNFRDVMTSFAVAKAVKARGKKVKMLFFWDDFDRFRKVPVNVPAEYDQYIGMPLSSVPDPKGEYDSYAKRFEVEFESAVKELEIDLEFHYQTEEYTSGAYDDLIIHALKNRRRIAEILYSFMSDKAKTEKNIDEAEYLANYYPIAIYSRFTGKDSTKIIGFDGESKVTYRCLETAKEDTVDLRQDHVANLGWKVDWPMRWKHYDVTFEPGGLDHSTPGSSYDVSSVIAKEIYGFNPPFFIGYQMIGIRGLGAKMSGSKGNAVSPSQLLEIYEPYFLKWLYMRKNPEQVFSLAFDSEIIRQYDELDREIALYHENSLKQAGKSALDLSVVDTGHKLPHNPLSFRQTVGLGQVVQWNYDKMIELLRATETDFDADDLRSRLAKAKNWLLTYNPDQIISLLDAKNSEYIAKMPTENRARIESLAKSLTNTAMSIKELDQLVYNIPKDDSLDQKENAVLQRNFFKDVYQLLIGRETGPRLSTFLWAVDRDKVLELLKI